jgi:hypothetical protein
MTVHIGINLGLILLVIGEGSLNLYLGEVWKPIKNFTDIAGGHLIGGDNAAHGSPRLGDDGRAALDALIVRDVRLKPQHRKSPYA